MTGSDERRIVVGVDEGTDSALALDWAADHADAVDARLSLVYAEFNPYLIAAGDAGVPPAVELGFPQLQPHQLLDDATARVARAHPRLHVDTLCESVSPTTLLLHQAHTASLVVLGNHGATVLSELLMGSVCGSVATKAACPVVAVRARECDEPIDAEVVVGADGSATCEKAVRFAGRFADAHDKKLRIVHVTRQDNHPERIDKAIEHTESLITELTSVHPGLGVCAEYTAGDPVRVLTSAVTRSHLLVVGARGRNTAAALLNGSVSHALIRQARCPVAVVGKECALTG
ncbi:MAG: universal stress protein [Sciscionella sp.]